MQRVNRVSYPRPRVTKLGPDDCIDWVIVPKPVLPTSINDTTFSTFQNIPEIVIELFFWVRRYTVPQVAVKRCPKPCFNRFFFFSVKWCKELLKRVIQFFFPSVCTRTQYQRAGNKVKNFCLSQSFALLK